MICFGGIEVIIYQTRGRVFHLISKQREVGFKNEVQPIFLTKVFQKLYKTLYWVFYVASQSINNS